MNKLKVRAHTCYLGKTGYNAHARGFFRALSKYVDLRVRNYTWDDNPDYLNEVDLSVLETITLSTGEHKYADFPIAENHHFKKYTFTTPKTPFEPDVDIVLMDMNHHYFYEDFNSKIKIAYTVWESTRLPGYFVDKLIEKFDYVWVVTEWHKKVLSEQGYPESRIHVVNEAVDEDFAPAQFDPNFNEYQDGRFKFSIFGRWDFRKSVPEIIDAFLKEFGKDEPVDLIMSVDNPYAVDGMNTTEERLAHYGFNDERLKVKHFVKRDEYIKYMQNGHVLITCARSEGWNIPLIEAIAVGTPALYTDYGAQLEFASGTGVPISIKGMVPCLSGDTYNVQALAGTEVPGYYAQPDYEDLRRKMRYAYKNYQGLKERALLDSERIRDTFTWENAALQAFAFFAKTNIQSKSKKSKEAAIILSHADSRIKQMRLNDLVDSLNSKGYTTIVSSHIESSSEADITLIDKHNPIVTRKQADELGVELPNFYIHTSIAKAHTEFDYNHGPGALVLLRNGLEIAKGKGFSKVHVINYDYFVKSSDVLNKASRLLDQCDIVSYLWRDEQKGGGDEMSTGFFSANVDKLLAAIQKVNTVEEYFSYGVHFENFFYNLCVRNNIIFKVQERPTLKELVADAETVPIYPRIHLGKDNFDYTFAKDHATGNLYISFFGDTSYPIEVRIVKGNNFVKTTITNNDEHYKISPELLQGGIKIYLPSFEKYAIIDENTKVGTIEIIDHSKVISLNSSSFKKISEVSRKITVHYIDGPYVEIQDTVTGKYKVEFIDEKTGEIVHSTVIGENCWTRANRKWYTDWRIKVTDVLDGEIIYNEKINLKNQRVFICFESASLGDTVAWIPYADEFRKKHGCKVIVSTFHNDLFAGQYPELEFVGRGVSVNNITAQYNLGWFYEGNSPDFDTSRNPRNFREQEMQKTASDILGLDFEQVRPKIFIPPRSRSIQEKYVCIGIHSTAQSKYWNNVGAWQKVVDYLNDHGYKVVLISKETGSYMGNAQPTGIIDRSGNMPLWERIIDLHHADFYIGLGSGLSWLAWAVGTPTVLISGFSTPNTEFIGEDVIRLFNPSACNGCFNRYRLDAGDWNWCPDQKGTPKMFECTKSITPEQVIAGMKKFMK